MSAYISIYIRANKSSQWIELTSYSRNTKVFQLLQKSIGYGKFAPLTEEILDLAANDAKDRIEISRKSIQECKSNIAFLTQLYSKNPSGLDVILERRYDELSLIEETEQDIEKYKRAMHELQLYREFLGTQDLEKMYRTSEVEYCLAYEANPNQENEEN